MSTATAARSSPIRRRVKWPPALRETPILAIHSRADELIAIEQVGHFETPRYVEHLAKAVPWLREVWRASAVDGGEP